MLRKEKTSTGIQVENMDLTVAPGDDFYDYATGGWRAKNPIPDDWSSYGSFEMLHDQNTKQLKEILESDSGKIGTLYKIFMDEQKLNAEGTNPAKRILMEIDTIKSKDDLPYHIAKLLRYRAVFWGDGAILDEQNSEFYLYNIGQGGTGLTRDYYFDDSEKSKDIITSYKQYIADIMTNFGISVNPDKIYELEKRMAKSFYTKEKLRDNYASYHKMTISEFKNQFTFDWDTYFKTRNINPQNINVRQPEALNESLKIIQDTDLELIKDYLKFRIVDTVSDILDDKTYKIYFDFYTRKLLGQKEPKSRYERAANLISAFMGEEVGKLYVKKHFSPAAKKRMLNLVENLRLTYAKRIRNLDWMSPETKEKALEKLNAIQVKIGYPDKWRDYSGLEIKNDSLFENIIRSFEFEDKFWMDKIDKRNDPTRWSTPPQIVNAFYMPSKNEICFPAGILQPPFFDMNADDAFNYGAIGTVIGHEITHGFDDSGREFDKDGNLKNWWTEKDSVEFNKRAKTMHDFFDKIEVAPNLYANGEYTLGENIGDLGGVSIAFNAYKDFAKKTNTSDKSFFLAYAMVWASNVTDERIIYLTNIDNHSLNRWRINGILPHLDDWYTTFGITSNDKLYIPPESRIKIW